MPVVARHGCPARGVQQEEHIKSGVPSNLRGMVWATVLNITNAKHSAEFGYSEMLELAIEVHHFPAQFPPF